MLECRHKLSNCPPFQSLVLCFGRISREGSKADVDISEALDNITVSNSSKNALCYEDDTSCQSLPSTRFITSASISVFLFGHLQALSCNTLKAMFWKTKSHIQPTIWDSFSYHFCLSIVQYLGCSWEYENYHHQYRTPSNMLEDFESQSWSCSSFSCNF